MIWGGIRQPLTFPLASRAARSRIADCLPGDYTIPRNSFNSLADLHEIWHTWHRWAESIAHQFWIEYDNSEFSVPSMGMFNDLKLFIYLSQMFQSATYAVFTDQFYTKLLRRTSWSRSLYLQSFSPIALGTKKLAHVLRLSLNRICRIAQPYDKSNWIEPISHILFPTYPSDIFQARSHRYGH